MRIDTTLTTNGHQSRLVERLKIFVSRVRFIPARKGIGHASVRVETAEALSRSWSARSKDPGPNLMIEMVTSRSRTAGAVLRFSELF